MGRNQWCHSVMVTRSVTLNRILKALNDKRRWEPFSYGLKVMATRYRLRQPAIPPAVGNAYSQRAGFQLGLKPREVHASFQTRPAL